MKKKIALISGITGQDGAYLAKLLLDKKEYKEIHGIKRRSSSFNTGRINHIYSKLHLHYGDITDSQNIFTLMDLVRPDEVYHLAAQSHVHVSFETPEYTANADAIGTLRFLEAIKILKLNTKFYCASSSEMFGNINNDKDTIQNEDTLLAPVSPYGVSKVFSHQIAKVYREAYDIFVCRGILFNHESPLRGETFVTRKITIGIANLLLGLTKNPIHLGNIFSMRDWGHAKDYVKAMWLMMQQDKPNDFVIATGKTYAVYDFINKAFKYAGINLSWDNENNAFITDFNRNIKNGYVVERFLKKGQKVIEIDKKYIRPLEVPYLKGDSSKAKTILGWEPEYSFDQLIEEMVDYDINRIGGMIG